ncbi:MAG: DUF5615 family PIN-like protein [Candidatus Hodarchaeales archaeon]
MDFLLDENVPRTLGRFLTEAGHSVVDLEMLGHRGASNGQVAQISLEQDMVIITFDADFLSLRKELQKQARILLIKMHPRDPAKARLLLQKHLQECIPLLEQPGTIVLTMEGIKENKEDK